MWSNLSLLNAVAFWGLWVAAISGGTAAIAGLAGGLAATRASDIASNAAEIKIAEANARANEAKLETARLWQKMAWRRVTAEQRESLKRALHGEDFDVWTSFVGNDPEARIFRGEIDSALLAAGLKTKFFSGWEVAIGLKVVGPTSEHKTSLMGALNAAHIPFTEEGPGKFQPNDLVIIVGTKPEP